MKLIVGLGNPGKNYKDTRHNIGFTLIDSFANNFNIKIDKKGFKGLYFKGIINGKEVILLKPQTFMNLSGECVKKIVDYYKIELEDVLVIYDDLDLPFASIRLREKGSSGGHKGIKSIISHLESENIKRLRFGIETNKSNIIDYVLSDFSKNELLIIEEIKEETNKLLEESLIIDFDKLMSKYNK